MTNETTEQGPRTTTKARAAADAAAPAAPTTAGPPQATGAAALNAEVLLALHAASDKKAVEPIVLDLRELASFTDYFLIASGTNQRQVQAISDEIEERLKQAGTRAERIEGYKTAEWVLLDYGDFIVHVFEDKARQFYDLERLWREAVRIELPPELHGAPGGSLSNEQ